MLTTKLFEIRDSATFIPVMATKMRVDVSDNIDPKNEIESLVSETYLLVRAGFAQDRRFRTLVQLTGINGGYGNSNCTPMDWGTTTMQVAHKYIEDHFDVLESGAVVDVEFILGKTEVPKTSDRLTVGT